MLRSGEASSAASIEYSNQFSNAGGSGGGGCGSGNSGRGDGGVSTSSSSSNIKNSYNASSLSQLPNVQVVFVVHDKISANYRRRYENQVTHQMSSTLAQFVKKEIVTVIIVELPPSTVNAIVGAINPREIEKKETEQEINIVMERFPKHRRYINEIFEEIVDYLTDAKPPIVALYSISDSYYRVII